MGSCGNTLVCVATDVDYGFVTDTSGICSKLGQIFHLIFEIVVSAEHESSLFATEGVRFGELGPAYITLLR